MCSTNAISYSIHKDIFFLTVTAYSKLRHIVHKQKILMARINKIQGKTANWKEEKWNERKRLLYILYLYAVCFFLLYFVSFLSLFFIFMAMQQFLYIDWSVERRLWLCRAPYNNTLYGVCSANENERNKWVNEHTVCVHTQHTEFVHTSIGCILGITYFGLFAADIVDVLFCFCRSQAKRASERANERTNWTDERTNRFKNENIYTYVLLFCE